MALRIIRAMFVLCCAVMGLIWTNSIIASVLTSDSLPMDDATLVLWRVFGAAVGAAVASLILFGLKFITQELYEQLFPVFIAISLAMTLGYFVARYIMVWFKLDQSIGIYLISTLVLVFGFIGISLGLTRASNWETLVTAVKKRQIEYGSPKIVDTSVIIDGRIVDIVGTGFLEGTLIVPRFVLTELQHIADSADVLRRNKGRRGLDIMRDLQAESGKITVEIVDDDPENVREVDGKILALAREYNAKIITTDFNLNKVAQIEGVEVLNINDLANAMKPAMLPDESLSVKIVKEGKESEQGVGYLDDGTMIVVDGGLSFVGKRVDVVVTSVLQTAAGRMIFTKIGGPESSGPRREAHEALR